MALQRLFRTRYLQTVETTQNARKEESPLFFVQSQDTELGPYSVVQLNRLKSKGEIRGKTLCRKADNNVCKRLDEWFPHLKDFAPITTERREEMRREARKSEADAIAKAALGASFFFWAPMGFIFALTGVIGGIIAITKEASSPTAWTALLIGAFGLVVRIF